MRKKSIVITVIIALVYISSWMTWGYVHENEFHSLTDAYLKNVKEFFHKTIKAYCNTDSPLQIFATGEAK